VDKIYRVIKRTPLNTGHVYGQVVRGNVFKNQKMVDALVYKKVLAEVNSPPLSEFPGWTLKSSKLAKIGIETVNDFLSKDSDELAEELGYKTRTIDKWKKEVEDKWLLSTPLIEKSK